MDRPARRYRYLTAPQTTPLPLLPVGGGGVLCVRSGAVAALSDSAHVAALLDLPEIKQLIADLDETRWTGRPGYATRTMVGAALAKAVYALPTWTRTARLIAEHAALREVIGGTPPTGRATGSRPSSATT